MVALVEIESVDSATSVAAAMVCVHPLSRSARLGCRVQSQDVHKDLPLST